MLYKAEISQKRHQTAYWASICMCTQICHTYIYKGTSGWLSCGSCSTGAACSGTMMGKMWESIFSTFQSPPTPPHSLSPWASDPLSLHASSFSPMIFLALRCDGRGSWTRTSCGPHSACLHVCGAYFATQDLVLGQ